MSVWLTPELQRSSAATYYSARGPLRASGFASMPDPDRPRLGCPITARSWISARDIVEQLRQQTAVEAGGRGLSIAPFWTAVSSRSAALSTRAWRFRPGPKFPRPSVHNFLLRYWARTKNPEALDMALLTLREMAKGGMHDQLGGGFHRYSVDERCSSRTSRRCCTTRRSSPSPVWRLSKPAATRSTPKPRAASWSTCCAT